MLPSLECFEVVQLLLDVLVVLVPAEVDDFDGDWVVVGDVVA